MAQHTLADGRGGITTRITARYVLGYLAMGRGDWRLAGELLEAARGEGESMRELQRLSPSLWGLAETALLRGDYDTAISLCDRGHALSAEVSDAAYLFPFLLTGVRAHLAREEQDAAQHWLATVEAALVRRGIPGTLPAVGHARGLLQLSAGDFDTARLSLLAARAAWNRLHRFWEESWATVDAARAALAARRLAEGTKLAAGVRATADEAGAATVVAAVDDLLRPYLRGRPTQPWHPLTEREYTVATLVSEGLTNREIAARLFVSPKTVSSHVEHILTKLGATRRAEIAAWTARIGA
jgi:DNA-binding CsgD family transcriptional regulator